MPADFPINKTAYLPVESSLPSCRQPSSTPLLAHLDSAHASQSELASRENSCLPQWVKKPWLLAASAVTMLGAYTLYRLTSDKPVTAMGNDMTPGEIAETASPPVSHPIIAALLAKGSSAQPDLPMGYSANQRVKKIYNVVDEKRAIPETAATPADEVKIEKMFDFSCIEERENLYYSDWLRIIGNTLQHPVTSLYKEVKTIHSHNTLGQGCPLAQETETPQKIVMATDILLSTLLGLLPGSQPLVWLQNMIGPGLALLADSLMEKEPDREKISALHQQLLLMIRRTIPALSQSEQASLYNPPSQYPQIAPGDKDILTKRFTLDDGKPQIEVEWQYYPLQIMSDGTPFITDEDQHVRPVAFDRLNARWVFVQREDSAIFTPATDTEREKYCLPLHQLAKGYRISANQDNKLVTVNIAGKPPISGVFIDGKFIPARWQNVDGYREVVTNHPHQPEKRILIYTSFGWAFERPSVRMDKYLSLLLTRAERQDGLAISWAPEDSITSVNNALGFCHSSMYGTLIKKDNKYFRTREFYNSKNQFTNREVWGYPQSVVEYENGMLKLRHSDDIPFALRNEQEVVLSGFLPSLNIESGALDYLIPRAKKLTLTTNNPVNAGLSSTPAGEIIFTVRDIHFVVRKYTDKEIYIKRYNDDPEKDMVLWLDGDTWLRVRTEHKKEASNYADYITCRQIRSPDGPKSCLPIMIEPDLHQRLEKHILKGTTCNHYPAAGHLLKSDIFDIPVLFQHQDTKQYYFYYLGWYFDAELIMPDNSTNPTDTVCVRLSGKGNFFMTKTFIADIVVELQQNKYYVKTTKTYLAEKLNIGKDASDIYVQNRAWRNIENIGTIEELVDEAVSLQKPFIAPLRKTLAAGHSFGEQFDIMSKKLFPERINKEPDNFYVKLFQLHTEGTLLNPYELKAAQHIKAKLKYIQQQVIKQVLSAIDYETLPWSAMTSYFRTIFKSSSNNIQFQADFTHSLKKRVRRIAAALDEQKIYLVTARERDETHFLDRTQSILLADERENGACAYMAKNNKEIYINIDKVDLSDTPQINTLADPVTAMLHAACYTQGMATDFIQLKKTNGIYPPIYDAIAWTGDHFAANTLTPEQLRELTDISKDYLGNVFAYLRKPVNLLVSENLGYLIKNDPGYLAHILLNSPDFLTLMTEDLYYRASMSDNNLSANRVDSWIRKYGIARGDISATALPHSISSPLLIIDNLAKVNVNNRNLHPVSGKNNIYYTLPDLDLLIKSGENYYPVEFIGKSNKVVFVGSHEETRQAYYYHPESGKLSPLQLNASYNNQQGLSYNKDVDLYESKNPHTGKATFFIYSEAQQQLVDTGALQILPMLGKITKVEFADFEFFIPLKASADIYLAAHGSQQLTLKKTVTPANVDIKFYANKREVLHGYVDDLLELVKNKIKVVETRVAGSSLEEYDIYFDDVSKINYHQLTQTSAKNLIRIKPDAKVASSEIIKAVSAFFTNKKINLHLYICRSL